MKNLILLKLMRSKGIGEKSIKKIINFISNNREYSWEDLISNKELLVEKIRLNRNIVNNIDENLDDAKYIMEQLKLNEVKMLIETDECYPQYLKHSLKKNCPPILFAKGDTSILNNRAVGFCGSRKVSCKGIQIAKSCAEQLVKENITVVSGYAVGTDLTAHISALINGGNTIFVLAEGILNYKIKFDIKDLIKDNYVFISQFLPTATWSVGNAMTRNNTIIGLSRAMILIESGKTGGTFAAGEAALKCGCPLFVVDFANPPISAAANKYFISQGGVPIKGKKLIPNMSDIFKTVKTDEMPADLISLCCDVYTEC